MVLSVYDAKLLDSRSKKKGCLFVCLFMVRSVYDAKLLDSRSKRRVVCLFVSLWSVLFMTRIFLIPEAKKKRKKKKKVFVCLFMVHSVYDAKLLDSRSKKRAVCLFVCGSFCL